MNHHKYYSTTLEELKIFIDTIMNNIPQTISEKDIHFVYLDCNSNRTIEVDLKSPQEIIELTDYDLLWRKEKAEFFRECKTYFLKKDTPVDQIIFPQHQEDDCHNWLNTNQIPLHDAHRNIVGILITYENMTKNWPTQKSLIQIINGVESSSHAISILDANGTHIYQNFTFSQLFEYSTVEELNSVGGPRALFADSAVAAEIFDRIDSNSSWKGEVTKISRTGRPLQVLLRADPIKEHTGRIIGLVLISTDITDRKQTEQKILENAQFLSTVIETVEEGITLSDDEGNFIIYNSKMSEITGYSWQEVEKTNNFLKLIYPDPQDYSTALNRINNIIKNQGVREFETIIHTKDGTKKNLLVSTSAIKYKNHHLFLSAYRDFTEHKQAQTELKQAEKRYQSLFENAIIGIFQMTPDWRYFNVNQALSRIYGYSSPTELIGARNNKKHQYFHPDRCVELEVLLQKDNIVSEFESQVYCADGSIIWTSENIRAVRDDCGILLYYEGTVENISERKHSEVALRQQVERERLMRIIIHRIRQSWHLEEILNTTVAEVREFLQTDRVLIYRFNPDWSGCMTAESVATGWLSVLGSTVKDPCFTEDYVKNYQNGRIQAVTDIYASDLSSCHINLLAQFQVRANLVVPIFTENKTPSFSHKHSTQNQSTTQHKSQSCLWGLMVCQHCRAPRQWQLLEISLLEQLAMQVGIAVEQAEIYLQLDRANQELERLATLDALTGVANRRQLDDYLENQWLRALREQLNISLILCDVDFFKLYNDTYGHQAGDRCLQQLAAALSRSVKRPADLVARYGGEEFAIILPHTDSNGAVYIAEMIKREVAAMKLPHAKSAVSDYITVSVGVACIIPQNNFSLEELIHTADLALYQAKQQGRDCAVLLEYNKNHQV